MKALKTEKNKPPTPEVKALRQRIVALELQVQARTGERNALIHRMEKYCRALEANPICEVYGDMLKMVATYE